MAISPRKNERRFLIIMAFLLTNFVTAVVIVSPSIIAETVSRSPKLNFPKLLHDFGTVKPEEIVSTSFQISNESDTTAFIREVSATCSCTVVSSGKTVLNPGESTELQIKLDVGQSRGKVDKIVRVIYTFPSEDTLREQRLVLTANVDA